MHNTTIAINKKTSEWEIQNELALGKERIILVDKNIRHTILTAIESTLETCLAYGRITTHLMLAILTQVFWTTTKRYTRDIPPAAVRWRQKGRVSIKSSSRTFRLRDELVTLNREISPLSNIIVNENLNNNFQNQLCTSHRASFNVVRK